MTLNPVEQRLAELAGYWQTFRNDASKRFLIWQANANALRMFQCFFEVQKHETDYTTGDLFIVFDTPFHNAIQYSRSLKESLVGQYQASHEDLIGQGITPDWQFRPEDVPDSASGFVQSLLSFHAKHGEDTGHLAVAFMPIQVDDDDAFASWLTRLLSTNLPERLRFVVVDSQETPRLDQLIASKHKLIAVDAPQIDALTVAQETFAQEGAVGPAAVFRNLLMGLMTLVEKAPVNKVKQKAADALLFARRQKWADQEVVINMLVAGALLKEKSFDGALKEYRNARKAAEQATAEGHPSGQQLIVQTLFGEAGVHLAADDLDNATACYDQAAALAQRLPDFILSIEALRMGAFCLARMKDFKPAVERGEQALAMGEQMEPDQRPNSTLSIAAVDLLRILDQERIGQMEHVKFRLNEQINNSQKKLDSRAAELEQSTGNGLIQQAEKDLVEETARTEQGATQQVSKLAQDGSERFLKTFIRSRELLSDSWPLDTLFPVEAATEAAGGAPS